MSAYLEARLRALNEAIRAYPTPIARCDDQLAGLLEERSAIFRTLESAAGPCSPEAIWTNDGGIHGA